MLFKNLDKYDLFTDFQFGLRSSRSIVYLLTVLSDTLLELETGLRLLGMHHLIYPRVLAGFGTRVIFTNSCLNFLPGFWAYLVIFQ